MIRFQHAGNQITHTVSSQNIKPVYKRKLNQGLYFPIPFLLRRYNYNFRLSRIIRGIKFLRCQKLSVRSRNLNHGHDSARLLPHHILLISILIKQQTPVHFLRRHQQMTIPMIFQRCNRIALCQIGNHLFFDSHKIPSC